MLIGNRAAAIFSLAVGVEFLPAELYGLLRFAFECFSANFKDVLGFIVLIFLAAGRLRKQGRKYVYLGVFFFLYLLHGLVESGINYSFLYLPLMYYAEKMERQNER